MIIQPVSRRKFFSFFGTGVAMLAKPDLFVLSPKVVPVYLRWNSDRVYWEWWYIAGPYITRWERAPKVAFSGDRPYDFSKNGGRS